MPSEDSREVSARYGDGRSAASHRASVRLGAGGLEIRLEASGTAHHWPYGEIEAATPIAARTSEALLRRVALAGGTVASLQSDAGATLLVNDPVFMQALLARAPTLSGQAERRRFIVPGLAVCGVLVLLGLGTWALGLSPIAAIARLVPERVWQTVGDQAFQSMTAGHPTCTGAAGRAALDRLMTKLSTASGATEQFDARIVDWSLLNAFALPGRRIVLTKQLIASVGSGDELAGVIAHEMGHGLGRHTEVSITRAVGLMAGAKLILGGGTETLGNVGLLLVQLRYTRDAEREADRTAVAILRDARIPASALGTFFERLKKREGDKASARAPEIFSTHPSLDERVKEIAQLPTYPVTPAMPAADLEALRGTCAK